MSFHVMSCHVMSCNVTTYEGPGGKRAQVTILVKNKNCSKIAQFSHTDFFSPEECHPGIFFVDLRFVFEKKRAEKRRRRPLFSFV